MPTFSYAGFCSSYSFRNSANNTGAQAVFNFLCKPENIHSMIIFANLKLPVISGIVKELENNFSNTRQFPLTNRTNRQTVGRMIKFILGHFGYVPTIGSPDARAKLRNFSEAELFKMCSLYELQNIPVNSISMKII